MADIDPIQPKFRINILSEDQLVEIKSAALHILETVGVRFPSERALNVFTRHGAQVDLESQVVRLSSDLVLEAMSHAPRSYYLSGRVPGSDLYLDGARSYFCTDACGTLTLDFESGQQRPSCKQDVARMARVADYLNSVSFYWPIVSAQDYGPLAPLHELQASFANTGKHVQTVTVTNTTLARHAIRMAEVIADDSQAMRSKPPLSFLICTVAPLGQDQEFDRSRHVVRRGRPSSRLHEYAQPRIDCSGGDGRSAGHGRCRDHQRHDTDATGRSWRAGLSLLAGIGHGP